MAWTDSCARVGPVQGHGGLQGLRLLTHGASLRVAVATVGLVGGTAHLQVRAEGHDRRLGLLWHHEAGIQQFDRRPSRQRFRESSRSSSHSHLTGTVGRASCVRKRLTWSLSSDTTSTPPTAIRRKRDCPRRWPQPTATNTLRHGYAGLVQALSSPMLNELHSLVSGPSQD